MERFVPEEIHRVCVFCGVQFNVEWQGKELTHQMGVCGKKVCQKHKQERSKEEKKDSEK